jgi:hypothetical protein
VWCEGHIASAALVRAVGLTAASCTRFGSVAARDCDPGSAVLDAAQLRVLKEAVGLTVAAARMALNEKQAVHTVYARFSALRPGGGAGPFG